MVMTPRFHICGHFIFNIFKVLNLIPSTTFENLLNLIPGIRFSNLLQHVWGKLYRILWCGGDHDQHFWFCSKDEKKLLAFRKGWVKGRVHCREKKVEGERRWEVESSWGVLKDRMASRKEKPYINLSDLSFVFEIGLEMWLSGCECLLLSQS